MNEATCPKCAKMLTYVQIEPMEIKRGAKHAYDGVSYNCPSCHAVLSIGLDPVSAKMDTLKEILAELEKARTAHKSAKPVTS